MAWEPDWGGSDVWFNGATASADGSVLIESEPRLCFICLTRFLHANRSPLRLKTLCGSRPRLPGAVDAVFEAGQLLGADRAAGVKFPGGDADLRAEAEFAAAGKLRRCVVQHDRRIDLVEEFARCGFVLGDGRIGGVRTVVVHLRDRFNCAV